MEQNILEEKTKHELQLLLEVNQEAKADLDKDLNALAEVEEDAENEFFSRQQELDHLSTGWRGEQARHYMQREAENAARFRREVLNAVAVETRRLQIERKRLEREEEKILQAIKKLNENND